jgi:hypothetical protein
MAEREVLRYCAFRKDEAAPVQYWMAYRRGKEGGYAGTTVVPATFPVFTAGTEEHLLDLAKDLGYALRHEPA